MLRKEKQSREKRSENLDKSNIKVGNGGLKSKTDRSEHLVRFNHFDIMPNMFLKCVSCLENKPAVGADVSLPAVHEPVSVFGHTIRLVLH